MGGAARLRRAAATVGRGGGGHHAESATEQPAEQPTESVGYVLPPLAVGRARASPAAVASGDSQAPAVVPEGGRDGRFWAGSSRAVAAAAWVVRGRGAGGRAWAFIRCTAAAAARRGEADPGGAS